VRTYGPEVGSYTFECNRIRYGHQVTLFAACKVFTVERWHHKRCFL